MDIEIFDKLCHYCAYQERCTSEVKKKLFQLKVPVEEYGIYIDKLASNNYLNEDRFVKYFVTARVKKKWGKAKLKAALSAKKIDSQLIKKYLAAIDLLDYNAQIKSAAEKKWRTIKAENVRERKNKLMRFLLSKGYEMEKVVQTLKNFY